VQGRTRKGGGRPVVFDDLSTLVFIFGSEFHMRCTCKIPGYLRINFLIILSTGRNDLPNEIARWTSDGFGEKGKRFQAGRCEFSKLSLKWTDHVFWDKLDF